MVLVYYNEFNPEGLLCNVFSDYTRSHYISDCCNRDYQFNIYSKKAFEYFGDMATIQRVNQLKVSLQLLQALFDVSRYDKFVLAEGTSG